jgi:hypothetical protein
MTRRSMLRRFIAVTLLAQGMAGCGGSQGLVLSSSVNWAAYVQDKKGGSASGNPREMRFRPNLCEANELKPEYAALDETDVISFLERQSIDVRIERPRADLIYLNLAGTVAQRPVRLRVAILPSSDEAGRELHEAILEHGTGSWGVHRSNLAILGPIGEPTDSVAFAAVTRLACWGVFTIGGRDDTFVVPGGYTEL